MKMKILSCGCMAKQRGTKNPAGTDRHKHKKENMPQYKPEYMPCIIVNQQEIIIIFSAPILREILFSLNPATRISERMAKVNHKL